MFRISLISLGVGLVWVSQGCGGTSSSNDGGGDSSAGMGGQAASPADACGNHDVVWSPWLDVIGPVGPAGEVYDGVALVERSTDDELILYFESPGEGAAPPVARHAAFSGYEPMPQLPVGATVWLTKDPPGNVPYQDYGVYPGAATSVRDQQGGTLLFGTALQSSGPAAPLMTGAVSDVCVGPNEVCPSVEGGTTTYRSVEILGDSTVTIADSETATVQVDGRAYDVQVIARKDALPAGAGCAADYFPDPKGVLRVDMVAQDFSDLVDGLPQGDLPTCVVGNAPRVDLGFTLYNVSVGSTYEGPVFYRGKSTSPYSEGVFMFDVVGLTGADGTPAQLGIDTWGNDILPEPELGAELWATVPAIGAGALRESSQGPLLLATVYDVNQATALLETMLGVAVVAEERCDYALDMNQHEISLSDVVFDTDPPVRVQSGESGEIPLGAYDYAVFAWSDYFTLYRL